MHAGEMAGARTAAGRPARMLSFLVVCASAATAAAAACGPPPKPPFPSVASLASCSEFPDPWLRADGTRVKSAAEWKKHREDTLALLEHYMYGHAGAAAGALHAHRDGGAHRVL